jgi:hypothetical protein
MKEYDSKSKREHGVNPNLSRERLAHHLYHTITIARGKKNKS